MGVGVCGVVKWACGPGMVRGGGACLGGVRCECVGNGCGRRGHVVCVWGGGECVCVKRMSNAYVRKVAVVVVCAWMGLQY